MIDGDRRSDAQQDAPDNAMRSGSEGKRAMPAQKKKSEEAAEEASEDWDYCVCCDKQDFGTDNDDKPAAGCIPFPDGSVMEVWRCVSCGEIPRYPNAPPVTVFSSDDEEEESDDEEEPPPSSSNAIPWENVEPNDVEPEDLLEIIYEPGSNGSRGTVLWADGDLYEGGIKDGKPHGNGIVKWEDGTVYDGEFKEGETHGRGTYTWTSGTVYVGEFAGGQINGWGTKTWVDGTVYEGQWADEKRHGKGICKYADGNIYDGEWKDDTAHGIGTLVEAAGLYEGQWVEDERHGKGTIKFSSGDIYEGVWRDGEKEIKGKMTWSNGDIQSGCFEWPSGRLLRSQRSQQQRLEKNVTIKVCEHCGAGDDCYKLRVCSGCNLALYCSLDCQEAASGSHRRICDIISDLPPRDGEKLVLRYDKENMDLDAGLRYGAKYMNNLKHLDISFENSIKEDTVKLSEKQLSSLLKSNKEALESVSWLSSEYISVSRDLLNGNRVWKELHGLKQLRLYHMRFDVQSLRDIIGQQKNTLMVLCLPALRIDWHKAKCRRTVAQAVSACKHLVKLDLCGCSLMDPELKIMLRDVPNLRILNLTRITNESRELTNNTCGLIARKCPGLQELNLFGHNQLSTRGIRKIFEGCPHLRAFYTTTSKLSCGCVQSLLDVAPKLMLLALGDEHDFPGAELTRIIEATGGRTVLQLGAGRVFEPNSISAKTREKYEDQIRLLDDARSKRNDPEVASVWDGMLKE